MGDREHKSNVDFIICSFTKTLYTDINYIHFEITGDFWILIGSAVIALFWVCSRTVQNNQSQSRKSSNSYSQHGKKGMHNL